MPFIAESRRESRIGVLQNSLYFKILYSMSNKSDPSGTSTRIFMDQFAWLQHPFPQESHHYLRIPCPIETRTFMVA